MSYQSERDTFIAQIMRALPATVSIYQAGEFARAMLRAATTAERLAVAQCNGDYPADNGERRVYPCRWAPCATCGARGVRDSGDKCGACYGTGKTGANGCGSLWAPAVLTGKAHVCPDCRTEARVRRQCAPFGVVPDFHGDPRGYVLTLTINGQTFGVPTRHR